VTFTSESRDRRATEKGHEIAREITVVAPVMNEVQFLFASEPRKPAKP
jgi:hypothetical protein